MRQDLPSAPESPRVREPLPSDELGRSGKSRGWVWLILLVVVGVGGWFLWKRTHPAAGQGKGSGNAQKAGAAGARRGAMTASVVAVKATKGNIGVFLTGLGSVTAINTVTVRSRVEGELMKVYYTEGQFVKKGDPLVDIDPRPYQVQLAQIEAQLAKDRAVLENSRLDLTRYQQLVPKRAIPEQTVATQKAIVAQNEGTIQADLAQIDSVKLNIAYCHITSPITGRLGLRLVDAGNYVQAGATTSLAVITQMDPISVIFTLAEDQLAGVLDRMRRGGRLPVDAYNREMTEKLATGTLTTIDNQIDQTTGTVKLRATFANSGGKLFPNQFVNARMLLQEKHGVTLLPTAAIQRNAQSTYVFLVKPDSTVTIRQVELGVTDGSNTEVTKGLAPGDEVVSSGVDRLQEGSKVTIHPEAGGGVRRRGEAKR